MINKPSLSVIWHSGDKERDLAFGEVLDTIAKPLPGFDGWNHWFSRMGGSTEMSPEMVIYFNDIQAAQQGRIAVRSQIDQHFAQAGVEPKIRQMSEMKLNPMGIDRTDRTGLEILF